MQTTERIRPVTWVADTARSLPIVLLSLFIVVAGVDALIVSQPIFIHSLRDDWAQWVAAGMSAPWATVLAATATVLCAALAASLVIVVVRGITDAPYLSLASALVVGCSFAISRMTLEIPLPMPVPLFASMSAILMLGGGALFQTRSLALNSFGGFLTSLPLALLGVGYARGRTSSGAPYQFDHDAQLLLGTLLIGSVGTLLIAVAARTLGALGGAAAMGVPSPRQVAKLLERVHAGEYRAAQAEYRLEYLMQHGTGTPRVDDEYEISRLRRSGWSWLRAWTLLALVVGGGASAFFGTYLPLREELATQRKRNHELTQQHTAALATVRAELDQARTAAPPTAAPGPAAPAPAVEAPAAASASEPKVSKSPRERARPPAPAARSGEPKQAAPKTSEPRSPVSKADDPLEGLDGL
jgi:hypothetical protein